MRTLAMYSDWKRWTVAALLISSVALAQTPAQSPPETSVIEGFVVRMGSGEPLAKAQVMLRPEQGRRPVFGALTDSGGRFRVANIRPGSYRLHVERDGYVDQQYGQVSPARPGTVLLLEPGQEVKDVVISLAPTGTISGQIFDEDGEPIEGATVRALWYDYEDGEKVLSRSRSAETNDLGEYRLYWLIPHEYYVSATYEDGFRELRTLREAVAASAPLVPPGGGTLAAPPAPVPETLEQIYVDTYYPGVHDPLSASPISLDPGIEIRAINFTLLPTRARAVRGTVVGPFSPEEGVSPNVIIVPRGGVTRNRINLRRDGGRNNRGSRDGSFELTGVAPGSYTVAAILSMGRRDRGRRPLFTGFVDIEVRDEDVEGLVVPVEPGIQLAGQVLVDESASELNVSRLRVRLEPMTGLPIGEPNARVDDDGSFVVNNVPRAPHRVSVTGLPADAYVASARVGGQDVLTSGVQVLPDMPNLEFWISGSGARLDGTVGVGDAPFTGAQVVLIPYDPARTDLYKVASADQYGRFSMRGIVPGNYRVFAWEDAPSGAYRDPEFVRRYEDWGERIRVEKTDQVQVQPRLIPAGN